MDDTERAILIGNVESSIRSLIKERKVKYIEDSLDFIEGLMIGMEIAGLYGDDIKELYTESKSDSDSGSTDLCRVCD